MELGFDRLRGIFSGPFDYPRCHVGSKSDSHVEGNSDRAPFGPGTRMEENNRSPTVCRVKNNRETCR
jgi:hypothetical protein